MTFERAPLEGITVIEFAGIGPVPFACGLLADLGARVIRIERPRGSSGLPGGLDRLGADERVVVELDLKDEVDLATAVRLCTGADIVAEGFRPGVAERLGIGPESLMSEQPGLIYVRVTGWGQSGPYASMAGHDINYIGLAGVLAAIGEERPVPPLNIIGDYAGGALYAVIGALAALVERAVTGTGRVVDAAMVDGAASLMAPIAALRSLGLWTERRAANLLDGGAPFYRTYETADGRYMAVGALEPAFYHALVHGLGLGDDHLPDRHDPANWELLSERFGTVFEQRTQAAWCDVFDGTDACVTPVLWASEVSDHPHNRERGLIDEAGPHPRVVVTPRMGHERRSRDEASVSDTLVAAGLGPEEATRLETERLAYWVGVTTPETSE